jgi:hypothetical protein
MGLDQDVLESMFEDKLPKFLVVVRIPQPRVEVASDDDVVGWKLV